MGLPLIPSRWSPFLTNPVFTAIWTGYTDGTPTRQQAWKWSPSLSKIWPGMTGVQQCRLAGFSEHAGNGWNTQGRHPHRRLPGDPEQNWMVSYPHHPGTPFVPALQSGCGFRHAEKGHPGCDQPVCDCPGPKQLTCGHFIDMAFMITKLWLRFYGVKTCCKMVDLWEAQMWWGLADIFLPIIQRQAHEVLYHDWTVSICSYWVHAIRHWWYSGFLAILSFSLIFLKLYGI
mgnify:CR=1 FL=1